MQKEVQQKLKLQERSLKWLDRSNRESATREKQERRNCLDSLHQQLDAPEAPVGYKHRWIRERVMDYDDKANIYKRQKRRIRISACRGLSRFQTTPTIDEGKNAGVIGQGGLLLARIPEEIVDRKK